MKALITTCFVLFAGMVSAQKLEKSVVANAGGSIEKSTISLEYTIGEVAVGNFTNNTMRLSQGFNQGRVVSNVSVETVLPNQTIQVFPNPTSDKLNIKCSVDATIDVVSVHGQIVMTGMALRKNVTQQLSVTDLPSGVYFIRMQTEVGMQLVKWMKQ